MKLPLISIIVMCFNEKTKLVKFLQHTKTFNYPNYEFIIINNDSVDGTQELIQKKYPKIPYIKNNYNIGNPPGYNPAIRKAKGKYIYLVQLDMIFDKNFFKELVKAAEKDPKIAAVGCGLYYAQKPNKIINLGLRTNFLTGKTTRLEADKIYNKNIHKTRKVQYMGATTMLYRKSAFNKIGLFDNRFFMGEGDADWCARARKKSYKLINVPTAKGYQKWTLKREIPPFRMFHTIRGKVMFMKKHGKFFPLFLIFNFLNIFFKSSLALLKGKFKLFLSYYQGYFSGIFNPKQLMYKGSSKIAEKY